MIENVGLGAPAYLQVPEFQSCLGTHLSPFGSHSEYCLPDTKPDLCPSDSWMSLNNLFEGISCAFQTGSVELGTPEYFLVSGFHICLGLVKVGDHTDWCMPEGRPETCSLGSWQKILQSFIGSTCRGKSHGSSGEPVEESSEDFQELQSTTETFETSSDYESNPATGKSADITTITSTN